MTSHLLLCSTSTTGLLKFARVIQSLKITKNIETGTEVLGSRRNGALPSFTECLCLLQQIGEEACRGCDMCAVYSTTPGDRHRVRFHLSSRGFAAFTPALDEGKRTSAPASMPSPPGRNACSTSRPDRFWTRATPGPSPFSNGPYLS